MLRVTHVVAGLAPVYGGPSYSVPRLCKALVEAGAEATLFSVAENARGQADVYHNGHRDCRFSWDYKAIPVVRRLRCSRGLSRSLRAVGMTVDVLHNHGLWLMPNIAAATSAARGRTPLVISPRGMLAPAALAFSTFKKRAFWALCQGRAVRGAACLHATGEGEYEEIRDFGLSNPVAIIPNGIDIPGLSADLIKRPASSRVVLSLGRLHPKKGLDRLIRAWAKVEPGHPGWRLRIVGSAEARHDEELRALAGSLGLGRVSVEDAIYGDAKTAAYRDAEVFVLSTLDENFGLTVAEALAAGTAAISTKGAPWSGLEREGCGWWIDHGIEPLAATLARAMALPQNALQAMGENGRRWMARDFSWDRVAGDMIALYDWLQHRTDMPAVVRLD